MEGCLCVGVSIPDRILRLPFCISEESVWICLSLSAGLSMLTEVLDSIVSSSVFFFGYMEKIWQKCVVLHVFFLYRDGNTILYRERLYNVMRFVGFFWTFGIYDQLSKNEPKYKIQSIHSFIQSFVFLYKYIFLMQ